MSVKVALFNHKGGVGKTTLTVNLAFSLSQHSGARVLIVDADPQCNVSSYLLEEDLVNQLLEQSDEPDGETIWSGIKPVTEGTGPLRVIPPVEIYENLFVLPGDIRLSTYERDLYDVWGLCFQRQPRALNVTTAMSDLVSKSAQSVEADIIFYDCGPNIGALNRVAILDCDFIVVPAALDQFSIRALKTLGATLTEWIQDWDNILNIAPSDRYMLLGRPVCVGFIAQRFRLYRGKASSTYSAMLPELEKRMISDIVEPLGRINIASVFDGGLKVGDVADLASKAQQAQMQGVPIELTSSISPGERKKIAKIFSTLATSLRSRIEAE